jgi:hypothetical protein
MRTTDNIELTDGEVDTRLENDNETVAVFHKSPSEDGETEAIPVT